MSAQQDPQHPQQQHPTLPIENGPETAIPQTAIPHMGTSQANVPQPSVDTGVQSHAPQAPLQTQAQAQPQAQPQPTVHMPPLPQGVTQNAIDAAIAQVEQTGKTDGISPEVMAAACAQIEARAKAQSIDVQQVAQSVANAPPQPQPQHGAETAVNDKQGTMQQFADQRDSLRQQVAEQRDAMQQPINAALNNGQGGATSFDPETIAELTRAVKDLDPQTLALINAVGQMSANPSILNTVVWIEVIRAMRRLIASEAKKQVEDLAPATPTAH
ncbi:hypothetical protein V5T82_17630 [Magnetovibrio sp. PR-2]|uniref:hypothetical protein n=1 Tax=Magnetovibrio sp. PR-2 TaxID=3120356 RepID=UPI002FCE1221